MEEEDPIEISQCYTGTGERLFDGYPMEFSPDRPFVIEMEDCHIVGPNAVVFSEDHQVVIESIRSEEFDLDLLKRPDDTHVPPTVFFTFVRRLLDINPHMAPFFEEDYIFPLISPDASYYHWVVEYLPKLRLLEHYERQTGRKPTVLVESQPREFVRQSLHLAGVDPLRCREWTNVESRVKRLVLPIHRLQGLKTRAPHRSKCDPSRTGLEWVRKRMRSNVSGGNTGGEKRIYVSRQKVQSGRSRKVANYDALVELLRDYGFTPYVLEELTFEAQVTLFADADMIMGPHGAGLVNMLFANDPLVIELLPDYKKTPYFYYIADMFDFEYEPIVSPTADGDLLVEIPALRSRLDALGI
jgi:capsular polysaccharide biosynthesis protein